MIPPARSLFQNKLCPGNDQKEGHEACHALGKKTRATPPGGSKVIDDGRECQQTPITRSHAPTQHTDHQGKVLNKRGGPHDSDAQGRTKRHFDQWQEQDGQQCHGQSPFL